MSQFELRVSTEAHVPARSHEWVGLRKEAGVAGRFGELATSTLADMRCAQFAAASA